MLFDRLIDRPNQNTLRSVLAGRRLDLIAPFARRGALDRIVPGAHDRVRIIARFPKPSSASTKRIDNDPRDFIKLIERMGRAVQVYALPMVHTKLYMNGAEAFYGSANFTITGFGGNPESLLATRNADSYRRFSTMFDSYLAQSTRTGLAHLRRLQRQLERGEIVYTASPENPQTLFANPRGDDAAHFRTWLATLGDNDSQYIEDRFDPAAGYNMSGHVQSAFPGIRAFLRENLDLIPTLANQNYEQYQFTRQNPEVVRRLRDFVLTKGHLFPAHGGGAWRHKLPRSFGGTGDGGRGSGLVVRMLIYLARYAGAMGF